MLGDFFKSHVRVRTSASEGSEDDDMFQYLRAIRSCSRYTGAQGRFGKVWRTLFLQAQEGCTHRRDYIVVSQCINSLARRRGIS
jgi:hypothetical protein